MEQNVSDEKARVVEHVEDTGLSRLPDEVQLALADIASVAREGLLALSVTAGLAVLGEMMEAERTGLCGPRDAKDPGRELGRNGTAPTSVVLGGRKVPIRRPRVHATDGSSEPRLESFTEASSQDLLTQVAMERMLAGISTRKYRRANEPIGSEVAESASGESRSSVSRRFVTGTGKALAELLGRDLSGLEVAVLMVDGVDFADQTCVVAMVITTDGTKIPVGLRHGDTENKTLVTAMLADLVDRGLDYSGGLLVVIDGAQALAAAVKATFGDLALIARCHLHKQRNVEGHLPKTERSRVGRRLAEAFNHPDPDQGLTNARRLASELERTFPDAAGSIREGLEDMFTVRRLGVTGTLFKTLMSTNPIESMISIARTTTSNSTRSASGRSTTARTLFNTGAITELRSASLNASYQVQNPARVRSSMTEDTYRRRKPGLVNRSGRSASVASSFVVRVNKLARRTSAVRGPHEDANSRAMTVTTNSVVRYRSGPASTFSPTGNSVSVGSTRTRSSRRLAGMRSHTRSEKSPSGSKTTTPRPERTSASMR